MLCPKMGETISGVTTFQCLNSSMLFPCRSLLADVEKELPVTVLFVAFPKATTALRLNGL